jgi:hypothetical protein
MLQSFEESGLNLQEAKVMLMSHSELFLPEVFILTADDFLNSYPGEVNEDALLQIVESWSIPMGSLKQDNPEYFFLANPVWERPIIKLDGGSYFLPLAGLFYGFCLELAERIVESDPSLQSKYKERRAVFLEEYTENLFRNAFPTAQVFRGNLWRDPETGKDFENDLLVLIDSYLIIIEAKSGRISDPARRGAELRLERTINDLLIEPAKQAELFAQYLKGHPGRHSFSTRRATANDVYLSSIHHIIRLNVTLDLLANLHARWTDLRAAGFIPHDLDIGPTMSLAELQSVFDVLDAACEKIHYLVRRAEFEVNATYFADEI